LEELDEPLHEIETKSGRSGAQEDEKGQLAEIKWRIIVLEQRIEDSETIVMTEVHREQTDTFMSKEELTVSLVPHVDELKGNLDKLRSNENGLKGNVRRLKGDWDDLAGLTRESRCIKYEVKTLKKR
jgi:archaellum component FlaC